MLKRKEQKRCGGKSTNNLKEAIVRGSQASDSSSMSVITMIGKIGLCYMVMMMWLWRMSWVSERR